MCLNAGTGPLPCGNIQLMYQKETETLMVKLSPFEAEFWPNTGSLKILKRKRHKSGFSRWTLAEITCHVEFSAKLSILFRKPPNHWNWFPSWPSEIAPKADCLACPFTDSRISAYEKKKGGGKREGESHYFLIVFSFLPSHLFCFHVIFWREALKSNSLWEWIM